MRPVAPRRWIYGLSKAAMALCSKVWFRTRYEGAHHVPASGPVLLVANHTSFLDPPLVGIATRRRVVFLARHSLARLPPMRWWLRQVGTALIDRDTPSKDVLRAIIALLGEGQCVCLFPEGTRSRDGSVGSFRGGLELLLRRSSAVAVPVGLDGVTRAMPHGAIVPRPRKIVVRIGEPWSAERVLAPGGVEGLRATVAALARAPLLPKELREGTGPDPNRTDIGHSAAVRSRP